MTKLTDTPATNSNSLRKASGMTADKAARQPTKRTLPAASKISRSQAKKCPLPNTGEYEDVRYGSLVLRFYKEDRK
jgi:hypothetical protein